MSEFKVVSKKRLSSQRSPPEGNKKTHKRKRHRTNKMAGKQDSKVTLQQPGDDACMSEWAKFLLQEMKQSETNTGRKIDALNQNVEQYKKDNEEQAWAITKVNACMAKLIQENSYLKDKSTDLEEHLLKLEYHSRRNNLQFDGFEEEKDYDESDKDCYNKVRRAIANLYDDDIDEKGEVTESAYEKAGKVVVNRIHRYGAKPIAGRTRPIIVNFQYYGDREHIMNNRKNLPEGIYVNEDFPFEIQQRCQLLRPILREALKMPKYRNRAKLKYDKLVIDRKEYTMANLDELPTDIHPSASCERSGDNSNVIAFFGMHSAFSNFHKSPFKYGGESFSCVEQFLQAEKVKFCNDDVARYKIMNTKDPREMKRQGRNLRNFVPQQWERDKAKAVLYIGLSQKFTQNNNLGIKLKETGQHVLIEATREVPWGCVLGLCHPGILDSSQWSNRPGLMSEVLARVRSELK